MSWQKCPVCEGRGYVVKLSIGGSATGNQVDPCTVCNGAKIIHTATGRPPVEPKLIKDALNKG